MGRLLAIALCLAIGAKAQISWAKMVWMPANSGTERLEHAALMVEVRLDGTNAPALMQLDTGCDQGLLYGAAYDQLDRKDKSLGPREFALSGTAAGGRFTDERFYVQSGTEGSMLGQFLMWAARRLGHSSNQPVLLGTIGAAFFEQRVLLLDFVAQRLAVLGYGAELPADLAQRFTFVPLEYRNNKMFVRLSINGEIERYLAFDTGSSSMAVSTSRLRWLEWTGRQPNDRGNKLLKVNAWGREVTLVGAPLKGAMCVGSACMERPLAFFDSSGLGGLDYDRSPFPIDGVFGNLPFDGRFTVVVDVPHGRFGLAAGSLAP